jgi:hypothetical protein
MQYFSGLRERLSTTEKPSLPFSPPKRTFKTKKIIFLPFFLLFKDGTERAITIRGVLDRGTKTKC